MTHVCGQTAAGDRKVRPASGRHDSAFQSSIRNLAMWVRKDKMTRNKNKISSSSEPTSNKRKTLNLLVESHGSENLQWQWVTKPGVAMGTLPRASLEPGSQPTSQCLLQLPWDVLLPGKDAQAGLEGSASKLCSPFFPTTLLALSYPRLSSCLTAGQYANGSERWTWGAKGPGGRSESFWSQDSLRVKCYKNYQGLQKLMFMWAIFITLT